MPFDPLQFPQLTTDRLCLVQLNATHAQAMFSLLTDSRVTSQYFVLPLQTVSDMAAIINVFVAKYTAGEIIRWGILSLAGNEFIGNIGFQQLETGESAKVIYALHPHQWGNGYAGEALKAVIHFGFHQLDLKTIEAEVMPGNTASVKVLLNAGFKKEDQLREILWMGKSYEMELYSLSRI